MLQMRVSSRLPRLGIHLDPHVAVIQSGGGGDEGAVCLKEPGRDNTVVRADGRFGVTHILSGRPRSYDAVAVGEGTRLLTIEADDFFDLLSNNIEIVKALFRQVL